MTGAEFAINESGVASSSRGLVGDTVFAVLPNVKPVHTFVITVAFQLVRLPSVDSPIISLIINGVIKVWLVKLWRNPTYKSFLTALTLSGWTSFLFGWHVHEKAVLLVLIPLRQVGIAARVNHLSHFHSLLAAERQAYFRTFLLASVAGVFSLFPLIFNPTGGPYRASISLSLTHTPSHSESIIKVVYSTIWIAAVYIPLSRRVYE